MAYDLIIFDLDGTLLNTLSAIGQSCNQMLSDMGFPTHPIASYKTMVGAGLEKTIRQVVPVGQRERLNIPDMVRRYDNHHEALWRKLVLPYPGIPELLTKLSSGKVQMAILSNKPQENSQAMVREILDIGLFQRIYGCRPGIPLKPDPFRALQICQELHLDPGKTIFIGDSGIDMKTAVNAQMLPVGVLWGFREERELSTSGARLLLSRPSEILEFLDSKV